MWMIRLNKVKRITSDPRINRHHCRRQRRRQRRRRRQRGKKTGKKKKGKGPAHGEHQCQHCPDLKPFAGASGLWYHSKFVYRF